MCRNTSADGLALLNLLAGHGVWTKRLSLSGGGIRSDIRREDTVGPLISGSGGPTVVFESGFSDTYEYWDAVNSTLVKKTTTVRYNRAGFGWSPLNDRPRTAEEIAPELHTALSNSKVGPPYIVLGHSAGGMCVGVFAPLFPADVAGILLVDPAPEGFYDILAREDPVFSRALSNDLKDAPPGAAP